MNDECIEDWNHYMQSQKILKNKQTKKKTRKTIVVHGQWDHEYDFFLFSKNLFDTMLLEFVENRLVIESPSCL